MRNVLISGIDTLLGSYFAARCLQTAGCHIFYTSRTAGLTSRLETTEFITHAACQMRLMDPNPGSHEEIEARLQPLGGDLPVFWPDGTVPAIDEIWYFAGPRNAATHLERAQALISNGTALGAREFNYVLFDLPAVKSGEEGPHEIARACKAKQIAYRIFRSSLVAGNGHPALAHGGSALSHFLSVLHSLKTEIEERSPQYFDFQALRCLAPREAAVNLVPAGLASELLLRIAGSGATLDSAYSIVSPQNTPFSMLCERIGIAGGLGLLPAEDGNALNAIDRFFHERSSDFHPCITCAPEAPSTQAYDVAGIPPDPALFDEDAQITLFESFRRIHDEAHAAERQRASDVLSSLAKKAITRGRTELTYYAMGSGTPVILLNALGQGLECWSRLMTRLVQNYRVIIWEPRGTVSPPPPFGLTDQVDDLDAIVQRENIEACHLVGWCTGAKVAIDFYLRRPSVVRSMAFLNSTFKCAGSPEELDSPYESNLQSLCRMLMQKPATAASVMKTFQSRAEESDLEILRSSDREQIGVHVLSLMNRDLKSYVLAPFKTAETTLNYAHQLMDFWSHDSRPKAAAVHIPVLLMGTEYDQVATPQSSEMAAELFPNARHVHVRGATHYCLYDRPEFVAGLLETFFATPDDLPVLPHAHPALAAHV